MPLKAPNTVLVRFTINVVPLAASAVEPTGSQHTQNIGVLMLNSTQEDTEEERYT